MVARELCKLLVGVQLPLAPPIYMETFVISDEELKKIDEWMNENGRNLSSGAIGGRYSYCFSPTSLGVVFVVKDDLTGKKLDLTDYDSW
jgi:hypothetical protein